MWGKAYEVKRGREGGKGEGEEMKREKGTEVKRKNEGGGETAKNISVVRRRKSWNRGEEGEKRKRGVEEN